MSSNYNGRRGPNVSQYLRELRTIPTDVPAEENYPTGDELLKFTNTQFFDFDLGTTTDYQAPPVKPESDTQSTRQEEPSSATSVVEEFAGLDFISGEFNFGDFGNTYASPTLGNFPDSLGSLQPIQPNPHAIYPAIPQHQQVPPYGTPAGSGAGEKRKASDAAGPTPPTRPLSVEEAARLAAEEDKRRRNTAASARFRIKKKQREQALEKSAKEMSEKVTALEGRISQLETENKWLKNLVMEKNGSSKDDMASLFGEFVKQQQAQKDTDDKRATKKEEIESKRAASSSVGSDDSQS
ncbi:Regulatory protein cys-3 [Pleurostoma richardsiae]|uniref:Regulatory protein cys-3 n=1 Tax=Pleurostoma richardsiae TaxID=41990 RepID=A0AA38R268_9PEZI|nr:Regulatory protein cys-3 [Pleurostoma richardsiae]